MADTTLATAWERIRDRVSTMATTYREDGETVLEVFADYSAVKQRSDQPVTFSFTVPDDTVDELVQQVEDGVLLETDVQYVDVNRTRLYVLEVYDEAADLRIFVAGGIDHQSLTELTNMDGPARTTVRSATGTVALELRHSDIAPFLVELRS